MLNSNLSNYEQRLLDGCCFGISSINTKETSAKTLDWYSLNIQKGYENFLIERFKELESLMNGYSIDQKSVYIVIEPDSFFIDYKDMYPNYWKNYDARQKISGFNGKQMSAKESGYVLRMYNQVYIRVAKSFGYNIIEPQASTFPRRSFYDAVHTTDSGSVYLGSIYSKNIDFSPK